MPTVTGRLRTPSIAAAPGSPVAGELYYNNAFNQLLLWNGSAWVTCAPDNTYGIAQAAHGLAVGNVVRYSGTTYVKALADTPANAEVVGVVVAVPDANNFTLLVLGQVTGLSGLTAGTTYFLSDATAGLLTATEPTTAGHVSKPLGVAISTTALYFYNMRGAVIGPTPKVTASAMSGGPPASPNDGDIWIATAVDTNGAAWQFRYNAGSASTYKWEFIGGPDSWAFVDTGESSTTTSAWVNLTTDGPSVTVARAGDYLVAYGASLAHSVATGTLFIGVAVGNGNALSVVSHVTIPGASYYLAASSQALLTAVAAASALKLRYQSITAGTMSAEHRWIAVKPVRVI